MKIPTHFRFAFVAMMFVLPNLSHAQLSLGIEGGLATGLWTSNSSDIDLKGSSFAYGGAQIKIGVANALFVQGVVQFSATGSQMDFPQVTGDTYYRLDQLTFMPALGYQRNNLGLFIGPFMSVEAGEFVKTKSTDWMETDRIFEDVGAGAHIGLSYDIGRFYLKGAYIHGINKLTEWVSVDNNGEPVGTTQIKNRTVQFGVGFNLIKG